MTLKTAPVTRDVATIQALRSDLALQIARHVARSGQSQTAMAQHLDIPQPTLSKIIRSQVGDLSLELLIRIAVRANLPVVLQTGYEPSEAGVHVNGIRLPQRPQRSRLANEARDQLAQSVQRLSPRERLEAQLRHSELLVELQRGSQSQRDRHAPPRRGKTR
jgi:predicted XRE-type DNA-binding protein